MSLILNKSIGDGTGGAKAAGIGNNSALGIDRNGTRWQTQLAVTQWMSAHPS